MTGKLLLLVATFAAPLRGAGPVVLIIGPPGSGKSTQAELLRKERGMVVISADDLVARNPQSLEKYRNPAIQGVEVRLDPALNHLVEEALGKADLSKGIILDGYPAAKTQADFFTSLQQKYELPKPVVIHLRVPDSVVRKRLADRKTEEVEQQLKDYHRELDFARTYFPEADIRDVDGTKKPDAVAKAILKELPK